MSLCTALFLSMIVAGLAFLTRSVFAGAAIVGVPSIVLFFVNHFKLLITSVPLQLSDLSLIFQMGDIAQLNSASIVFTWRDIASIVALALWLVLLFFFSKPLRLRWSASAISAAATAAAFVLIFIVFVNPLICEPLYISTQARVPATTTEMQGGIVLSMWRSVVTPKYEIDTSTYGEDLMDGILSQVEEYAESVSVSEADSQSPNIIVVLSESFFDITSLGNLTFETDPIASFRKICEDSVSGTFYAPTHGYGTANIELNILTGIDPSLMKVGETPSNWDGYKFDYIPAIPRLLSENGYYTASLHTFNDSIYERMKYFGNLGFEDCFFSGDFAEIDDEAAAAENYYTFLNEKISGGYYSDDYLSDVMIKLYEKKKDDGPVFLYGFTMENHSPYTEPRDGDGFVFESDVELTDEAQTTIANLAQGLHNSAAALEKLVNYFSQVDEPTMIVFFGDHRPGTGLSDNSSVYSQLGLVPDDAAGWSLEQYQEFYSTSYLIWANDDSLLPAQRGSGMDSSANYLGLPILEASGVELPLFWKYLKSMNQDSIFYSWQYYISADGTLDEPLDLQSDSVPAHKHWLMGMLLYDTFYGEKYLTEQLGGAG